MVVLGRKSALFPGFGKGRKILDFESSKSVEFSPFPAGKRIFNFRFNALLHFKNLSVPCSWKEGSCFSCNPPISRKCNTAKTKERAWGGLGGGGFDSGSYQLNHPSKPLLWVLSVRPQKVPPPAGTQTKTREQAPA